MTRTVPRKLAIPFVGDRPPQDMLDAWAAEDQEAIGYTRVTDPVWSVIETETIHGEGMPSAGRSMLCEFEVDADSVPVELRTWGDDG